MQKDLKTSGIKFLSNYDIFKSINFNMASVLKCYLIQNLLERLHADATR